MEEKSRAPEFYGFTAWLATWVAFVLFVLWAATPDGWIVKAGITWYPNR
jgi:phosphatidylinositol glycan class P protein